MCRILLSIKPEYVDKILTGAKKFEYRKTRCTRPVKTIVIYSTHPTRRIIGEATVQCILEGDKDTVWEQTKKEGGISKQFFDAYFKGRQTAVAYKLGPVKKYDNPMKLQDLGLKSAPQSFVYLD